MIGMSFGTPTAYRGVLRLWIDEMTEDNAIWLEFAVRDVFKMQSMQLRPACIANVLRLFESKADSREQIAELRSLDLDYL